MLAALSPSFSTAYGWPLADHNNNTLNHQSLVDHDFPSFDHETLQQDFAAETSSSFGGADNVNGMKKLNHNASERDRRKRVNNLYESLRSALPISNPRKKKVSIPGIVSHAVKYIPELQQEIEKLIHKKETLLSSSSSSMKCIKKEDAKLEAVINEKSSIVSSVSVLGEKEAVIQLISSTNSHIGKNKDTLLLMSKVLEKLEEEEEDEFILLNATTFKCFGEGMFLNTIHFKVEGNQKIEAEKMKEKLHAFFPPTIEDRGRNSHWL